MVEDVNDNKPELPTADLVLCEKEGELGSVLVVAKDSDRSPFSDPFTFNLPKDHDGKWSVTRFNSKRLFQCILQRNRLIGQLEY